jgi:hypothetical protein
MSTTDVRPTPTLAELAPGSEALEVVEHAATLLAALVLEHYHDGAEVLAIIATRATEILPRGMSLVDGRPGSWEADLVERLVHPDAVAAGPGPTPLDVECPRCGASPSSGCWNPRTYDDNKHPHRERLAATQADGLTFSPEYGWWG